MPTILEYSKAFSLLKRAVHFWCKTIGGWLLLDSYLLPSEKQKNPADQRDNQRERARQRLMRGDQNEQIGLLEVLEAIEDDTTDEESVVDTDEYDLQNSDKIGIPDTDDEHSNLI